MVKLVKNNETERKWLATPIVELDLFLAPLIHSCPSYNKPYALRKNLAYNIQYLQFQHRIIKDIKMSSVIYTQAVKNFILTGAGIAESLLYFVLIKNGLHKTTEWQETGRFKGNEKNFEDKKIRIDNLIFEKLKTPELLHMTFDSMIKCAKSHRCFGNDTGFYNTLEKIRKLRNKVHLQVSHHSTDTDWNTFNYSSLSDISKVLYYIFNFSVFSPTKEQKKYFDFLRENYK